MNEQVFITDDEEVDPHLVDLHARASMIRSASQGRRLRLFADDNYPTQFEIADPNFVGEVRGAYVNDRWDPSASMFGPTRNGGRTTHIPKTS